ncbi:RNA polymerase sigma-70 factor, ECF subfamily [Cystobacter fuscus DSM 2262]|uniref:RNA polymerase sigma-70 factor, ECF subfamily n=1 Tax=Cystobacter fuscus (strain ATCC 25194 / DSM 2262 / NBRC 100088 / M29) TaxID=1242864 RepID=S9PLL8_CYSF2|nr:RNA polymerase sigma-70 factor, ECF subfamily [Cystobacter fuscus DSM 2262]
MLENYHLLPSVRGDSLEKLGHFDEAHAEFERETSLTHNERDASCSSTVPAHLFRRRPGVSVGECRTTRGLDRVPDAR